MYSALVFAISALITFLTIKIVAPKLLQEELSGIDLNKPGKPKIPEMGGLAFVLGLSGGVLLAVGFQTFLEVFKQVSVIPLLMALLTTFIIAYIGIIDDLIGVRQEVKAFLPLLASVPLIVIKVEQTTLGIPMIGFSVDVGIIYPLILVPLALTVGANAVNMLAGFNGLEAGMATIAIGFLGIIAWSLGAGTTQVLLVAALGAIVATLYFNWYPARILIGDVGTFSVGAIITSAVIIGNFEFAGVILLIPYALDFSLKAIHGFPSERWGGEYEEGKLYCPDFGPVSLPQLVMKITGGVTERWLSIILMGLEGVFGVLAIVFYLI